MRGEKMAKARESGMPDIEADLIHYGIVASRE
jgi:hypothetical protein